MPSIILTYKGADMDWHSKKVIVTGGGGFLGRYIVERLLELKCKKVISMGRSPQPELENLGVEVVCGDIVDTEAVIAASSECDIIFHTAAKAGIWGSYRDFYNANVVGTANVIKACRKNNIKILINTSTPSVVCEAHEIVNGNEDLPYPDHYPAHYPATKAEAERMVADAASAELLTVSLRPHLLWGVRDSHILPKLVERAKCKRLMQVGSGKNMVDMTHIRNAAEAHINAAEALEDNSAISGNKYFISDDAPVNLWDWGGNFLKDLGLPETTKSISFRRAYKIGAVMEFIFKLFAIRHDPPMTRFAAIQLAYSHYFDISAAKKDLKYKPVVEYEKAYSETVKWMRESL